MINITAIPIKNIQVGIFCILFLFPFILLPAVTGMVLTVFLLSASWLLNTNSRPQANKPVLLFCGFALLWILFDFVTISEKIYFYSQINHFLQFTIYYFLLISLYRASRPESIFRDIRFLLLTFFVLIANLTFGSKGLEYHAIDLNFGCFLISSFYYLEKKAIFIKILLALIIIAFVSIIVSRSSFFLLILFWGYFLFFKANRIVVLIIATIILATPLFTAMLVTEIELSQIYDYDENSGIRIEFIRSAYRLMLDNYFLGNGFETPYRDISYYYLEKHNLLTSLDSINIVSNHNSLIDITLRVGLPMSVLFVYGIMFHLSSNEYRPIHGFLIMSIAIGLSVDAWFENQLQLLVFSFMSSFLFYLRTNHKEVPQNAI